jgi:alkylated DNA repair dioxygenase AlkB
MTNHWVDITRVKRRVPLLEHELYLRQATQWSKDRQRNGQKTDNTMVKRQTTQWLKDKQHNDQKTDNTMVKRQTTQWSKDRQHNGQKTDNTMVKKTTTQWCCLSFDHCVVCLLTIVLSVV